MVTRILVSPSVGKGLKIFRFYAVFHDSAIGCTKLRLTEDQFEILDHIQRHHRVAITGCAGSGKTLVALEKAIRLDNDGFRVLVLCHNPFLAEDLRRKSKSTSILIYDFSSFVNEILSRDVLSLTELLDNKKEESPKNVDLFSRINKTSYLRDWTTFSEPTEDDINKAFDRVVQLKLHWESVGFDAVIVDEGQDFRQSWWILTEEVLVNPEASFLYIFFDDTQAIFPYGSQSNYPIELAPFPSVTIMVRQRRAIN